MNQDKIINCLKYILKELRYVHYDSNPDESKNRLWALDQWIIHVSDMWTKSWFVDCAEHAISDIIYQENVPPSIPLLIHDIKDDIRFLRVNNFDKETLSDVGIEKINTLVRAYGYWISDLFHMPGKLTFDLIKTTDNKPLGIKSIKSKNICTIEIDFEEAQYLGMMQMHIPFGGYTGFGRGCCSPVKCTYALLNVLKKGKG